MKFVVVDGYKQVYWYVDRLREVQGYLAHKITPIPLGTP